MVILGRNTTKSQDAAQWLQAQHGADAFVVTSDVSKSEEIDRAVAETLRKFGRIDILVNNAGINIRKPPDVLSLDEWNTVVGATLRAHFCYQRPSILDEAGRRRQDHQYRQHDVDFWLGIRAGVCDDQGGNRAVDQEPGLAWPRTIFRSTQYCPAGSTPSSQKRPGKKSRAFMNVCWHEPRRDDGPSRSTCLVPRSGSQAAASNYVTGVALPVDGGYSSAL